MAVQQEVAFRWNESQTGRRVDVLLDRAVPDEKNAWLGRSYADAPDVDGVVYVTGKDKDRPNRALRSGGDGGVRFGRGRRRAGTIIGISILIRLS